MGEIWDVPGFNVAVSGILTSITMRCLSIAVAFCIYDA